MKVSGKRKRLDLDSGDEDEKNTGISFTSINEQFHKDEIFAIGTVPQAEPHVYLDQLMSSPFQTDNCINKRPPLLQFLPMLRK